MYNRTTSGGSTTSITGTGPGTTTSSTAGGSKRFFFVVILKMGCESNWRGSSAVAPDSTLHIRVLIAITSEF